MKPHKHCELIKAWADGAIIEARYYKATGWTDWQEETGGFIWYHDGAEYRIKPKEDIVCYEFRRCVSSSRPFLEANLKLVFDGETKELKSAEILK